MKKLAIDPGGPLGKICKSLGLKNVRRLVLSFDVDEIHVAYVIFYPDVGPLGTVAEILADCEKPKIVEVESVNIGDQGQIFHRPKE